MQPAVALVEPALLGFPFLFLPLRSTEMLTEYEPGSYISHISPTPLLLVVERGDNLTVAALAAYEHALMPKRLVMLDGGHFDAYAADFDRSAGAAVEWFTEHLLRV
jgi:hypothetical protein